MRLTSASAATIRCGGSAVKALLTHPVRLSRRHFYVAGNVSTAVISVRPGVRRATAAMEAKRVHDGGATTRAAMEAKGGHDGLQQRPHCFHHGELRHNDHHDELRHNDQLSNDDELVHE